MFSHETYLSPFTWRYGSEAMRRLWSEAHRRRLWRRLWVALAEVQAEAGLVTPAQVDDLRAHQDAIDLERAHQIEAEIRHDLMAEVKTYAEQCPVGGGIIHLGATSMDIEDNADALRLNEARRILLDHLRVLLALLADQIDAEAGHVCMAFTHLQPAEPTTVGYRLATYAQDLLADYQALCQFRALGKGFKGAVGTGASYAALLEGTSLDTAAFEARIMDRLGLDSFPIANQTYPRRQDWEITTLLAGLGMTLYRFAFDLRLLQSPPFGEWSEPFGTAQVGSSAMPFKRNPIYAENMDSLARHMAALPRVAWDNAAHSLLERTLDDSANRRLFLPEAFLIADELLTRAARIVKGLQINRDGIARNLQRYGVFAATERVLMACARSGADRQVMHEVIREHSMTAWSAVQRDEPNPLPDLLCTDPRLTTWLPADQLIGLLHAETHIGDAESRARALAARLRAAVAE